MPEEQVQSPRFPLVKNISPEKKEGENGYQPKNQK